MSDDIKAQVMVIDIDEASDTITVRVAADLAPRSPTYAWRWVTRWCGKGKPRSGCRRGYRRVVFSVEQKQLSPEMVKALFLEKGRSKQICQVSLAQSVLLCTTSDSDLDVKVEGMRTVGQIPTKK